MPYWPCRLNQGEEIGNSNGLFLSVAGRRTAIDPVAVGGSGLVSHCRWGEQPLSAAERRARASETNGLSCRYGSDDLAHPCLDAAQPRDLWRRDRLTEWKVS